MKKLITLAACATLVFAMTACGSEDTTVPAETAPIESTEPTPEASPEVTPETAALKDGVFEASSEPDEKGFVSTVTVTVANGVITEATYDAASDTVPSKYEASKDGSYDMKTAGAQSDWYEQADLLTAYLVETQDPNAINLTDEEGHTDSITGVSIKVGEFVTLANEAIAQAQ